MGCAVYLTGKGMKRKTYLSWSSGKDSAWALYQLQQDPSVHVAGLFWPRRRFMRYPGVIRARFLPPIPPGLPKDAFFKRLVSETETACDALLIDVARSPNPPPLPQSAVARLKELGETSVAATGI